MRFAAAYLATTSRAWRFVRDQDLAGTQRRRLNLMTRITLERATVYRAGWRRYLSKASAYNGLAREFIRHDCECDEASCCWYHEQISDGEYHNLKFATRQLIGLFRQGEKEEWDDATIKSKWEAIQQAEDERQRAAPKVMPTPNDEQDSTELPF